MCRLVAGGGSDLPFLTRWQFRTEDETFAVCAKRGWLASSSSKRATPLNVKIVVSRLKRRGGFAMHMAHWPSVERNGGRVCLAGRSDAHGRLGFTFVLLRPLGAAIMEYGYHLQSELPTTSEQIVNDELNLLWDEHANAMASLPPPQPAAIPTLLKAFRATLHPRADSFDYSSGALHQHLASHFSKESLEPMAFNPYNVNHVLNQFPELHPLDGTFLRSAFDTLDPVEATTTTTTPRGPSSIANTPRDAVDSLSPQTSKHLPSVATTADSLSSPRLSTSSSVASTKQVICQVPDCGRRVRSKGFCKAHGGGRKCTMQGCNKSAQNGDFCIGHGGGKQCSHAGCGKAAQSHGLCKAHGGGARCKHPDCMKSSQGGGYCRAHGGGKRCQAANCTKGAQRGNFCATHGGFRNCQIEGCVRTDRGGGYCEVHRRDKLCTVKGCKKLSKNNGLCTLHLRGTDGAKKSPKAGYALPPMLVAPSMPH
ncbi:Aste57867_18166 [Aphanomyces stellatus]|uniref:Aste57867_18166 protein n=1 Tax=Aphanomyces stellatus TaxID=120398 RepID=A0A485LD27_9STRA|nr:hypothetical protein As57867_018104 [Aphanomyces stellatus]VFT94904.1 Aste57867_18166 [Aphanomyces stellatus]